ncbi:hypothetical protein Btru_016050 [Bulinus truncatus]|nr:hypothetical protein Btru_016050 [Bulinus truncatus]
MDKEKPDYRIFGSYTRNLYSVFKKYDNSDRIQTCNLRKAFNDLSLYPSYSQILEMVHFAEEIGYSDDAVKDTPRCDNCLNSCAFIHSPYIHLAREVIVIIACLFAHQYTSRVNSA